MQPHMLQCPFYPVPHTAALSHSKPPSASHPVTAPLLHTAIQHCVLPCDTVNTSRYAVWWLCCFTVKWNYRKACWAGDSCCAGYITHINCILWFLSCSKISSITQHYSDPSFVVIFTWLSLCVWVCECVMFAGANICNYRHYIVPWKSSVHWR